MPAGVSAWTPLANLTLGSATTGVTFSSISGAYKDLRLVINGGVTSGGFAKYRLNGDSSSTYLWATLESNGTSATSAWNGNDYATFFNNYIVWNSSDKTVVTLDILDYSATDKHKTIMSRTFREYTAVNDMTVRWPSTAAVTTLYLYADTSTWVSGTTFALYGVSA